MELSVGRTERGVSSYIILLVLVGTAQRSYTLNRNLADKRFARAVWFVAHLQEKNVRWVKQPCAWTQRIRQERPGRLVHPDTGCIDLWTPGAFR